MVREGSFEILFKDETLDPGNSCWTAFNQFRYIASVTPPLSALINLRTTFVSIKRYHELGLVFFGMYNRCDFDTVLVEFGKRFQSVTGLVDLFVVSVFSYIEEIGSA